MLEAGQDLPLGDEAVVGLGARQAGAEDLDGDIPLKMLILPVGEIDGSHAAAADPPQQPVGAEASSLLPVVERESQQLTGRAGEEAGPLLVDGEQPLHVPPEGGVPGARAVEESRPLRRRPVQGLCEEVVHLVPAFGIHRSSLTPVMRYLPRSSATRCRARPWRGAIRG